MAPSRSAIALALSAAVLALLACDAAAAAGGVQRAVPVPDQLDGTFATDAYAAYMTDTSAEGALLFSAPNPPTLEAYSNCSAIGKPPYTCEVLGIVEPCEKKLDSYIWFDVSLAKSMLDGLAPVVRSFRLEANTDAVSYGYFQLHGCANSVYPETFADSEEGAATCSRLLYDYMMSEGAVGDDNVLASGRLVTITVAVDPGNPDTPYSDVLASGEESAQWMFKVGYTPPPAVVACDDDHVAPSVSLQNDNVRPPKLTLFYSFCGDGTIDDNEQCDPNGADACAAECSPQCTFGDRDGDFLNDCDDACPDDPLKGVDAGVCGCGIVDVDVDNSGFMDCDEVPLPTEASASVYWFGWTVHNIESVDGDAVIQLLDGFAAATNVPPEVLALSAYRTCTEADSDCIIEGEPVTSTATSTATTTTTTTTTTTMPSTTGVSLPTTSATTSAPSTTGQGTHGSYSRSVDAIGAIMANTAALPTSGDNVTYVHGEITVFTTVATSSEARAQSCVSALSVADAEALGMYIVSLDVLDPTLIANTATSSGDGGGGGDDGGGGGVGAGGIVLLLFFAGAAGACFACLVFVQRRRRKVRDAIRGSDGGASREGLTAAGKSSYEAPSGGSLWNSRDSIDFGGREAPSGESAMTDMSGSVSLSMSPERSFVPPIVLGDGVANKYGRSGTMIESRSPPRSPPASPRKDLYVSTIREAGLSGARLPRGVSLDVEVARLSSPRSSSARRNVAVPARSLSPTRMQAPPEDTYQSAAVIQHRHQQRQLEEHEQHTWEIPFGDLVVFEEVGRGSFGAVHRGQWRGRTVAIKRVISTAVDAAAFETEAETMARIEPHVNVLLFIGACLQSPLCIVTEFVTGGSLDDYLADSSAVLQMADVLRLSLDILRGVGHLHAEGIVHRDIAARNVLLDGDGVAKLCDFGLSRVLEGEGEGNQTASDVGPLKWMAPESIISRVYSAASDVWSLGVLFAELLSREQPFPELSAMEAAIAVTTEGRTAALPDYCPAEMRALIEQRMWARDPRDRPTIAELTDAMSSWSMVA